MARAIMLLRAFKRAAFRLAEPGEVFIYFRRTLIRGPGVLLNRRGVTGPTKAVSHILWWVTHSLKPGLTHESHVDKEKDKSYDDNPHYNYTLKILRTALAVTPPLRVVGNCSLRRSSLRTSAQTADLCPWSSMIDCSILGRPSTSA